MVDMRHRVISHAPMDHSRSQSALLSAQAMLGYMLAGASWAVSLTLLWFDTAVEYKTASAVGARKLGLLISDQMMLR